MICPDCQAENKGGAKFCNECGTPLTLRCPRCGAAHRAGQKFCDECGLPLAAASGLAPPAAASGFAARSGAEPASETAEMRLVSVMFVDLVGFTSLSESRDAADVRELLGRYFDSARTIVERYGGTIEKFIGDAVMAVWGVPVAQEDDAERAVRAALDVVDAVRVFGAAVDAPDLRARAGVVTGQVAALENPGEGLVVGDRVNTASRVQSAAQPGWVLVDEVTRGATSASIVYEDAGEHAVKGKADPLRLWRALRVVSGMAGNQRAQGIDPPFVGRDADLRLLKELFHAAQDRRSTRLVGVIGAAGIGKSRLLREFFIYVDGLSHTVLWHSGRCLSYGEGVAYWALAEMVRQRLGIPEDAPLEEAGEKLAAGLARWVPEAGDRDFLAPRLGALLGLSEPGLGREELFAGWRMFFERLAAHEPVVLVFEDLQWADQGLLDFIEQLLDWSSDSPIFILTLARPEMAARHQGWPAGQRGATVIGLEPLHDGAMRELLNGVVSGLPRDAADRIVARAEGVPLYAVETLRALIDRGAMVERGDELVLIGDLGQLDVPASLGSLLAARIDALTPEERQLVKAMSVFGGTFPASTASALAGVEGPRIGDLLSSLVRKQVLAIRADHLTPDRGQYGFAQGLLRTVAYEMLSRQERKGRHLAAAEHLREVFPGEGEEVAEAIATHLLDAYRAAQADPDALQIRERAVEALRRAAQRAGTVGAPETAERTYLHARGLVEDEAERVELSELAGEMSLAAGRYDVGLRLLDEAFGAHERAGRHRQSIRVIAAIGDALTRLGRNDEAVSRLTAALERLEPGQFNAEVGEVNAHLARAYAFVGDYERASSACERALQIATDLQLRKLFIRALNTRVLGLVYQGRVVECQALLQAVVELAEQHGMGEELARAQNNTGNVALQWDLPDGEEHLKTSLALARRAGNPYMEGLISDNLGTLYFFQGQWQELKELVDHWLAETAHRPGTQFVQHAQVLLLAHRGQTAEAASVFPALGSWENSDDADVRSSWAAAATLLAQYSGHSEEALAMGLRMLPEALASVGPASDPVRLAWPVAVRAGVELGRPGDVRALLDLLSDTPPGRIPPYLQAEIIHCRGLLAGLEGRHEEVEDELAGAVGALAELGYPYHLALAQADLAGWLLEQSRLAEAALLLEAAIDSFASLRAAPALERAERLAEALSRPPAGRVSSSA
ncbi:MAG TPA: adenylate/guanylate cyclase domain-containing protein [Solirubrobacteraceae bacterium]|nr:adenylate/guanylate cyclase domain-containing protein [Solirubrobacteraceae bacterium]